MIERKFRKKLLLVILVVMTLFFLKSNSVFERISASRFDVKNHELLVLSNGVEVNHIDIIQDKDNYLIRHGKVSSPYKSRYGRSCFTFFYKQKEVNKVCYFKKNNHHLNKHIFSIDIDSITGEINMKLRLEGVDSNNVYYPKSDSMFISKTNSDILIEIKESEENKTCDLKDLMLIENQELDVETVKKFLLVLSDLCRNNVEFIEVANEVLFQVLDKVPGKVVALIKEEENIDEGEINYMLQSPIHDGFDLKQMIQKLKDLPQQNRVKLRIIKSLEIALAKY